MHASKITLILHLGAIAIAAGIASVFFILPAQIGSLSLITRLVIGEVATLFFLFGAYPFIPWFSKKTGIYSALICLPTLIVVAWYFYSYLPAQSIGGVTGQQLASALISERSSNGIIEIGFAYPIYTPTIRISNNELFTKEFDVYLRILDSNNDAALFRAVRSTLPDARLSVEATVNGLLSENSDFIFIPIEVPPGAAVDGKVVFIISNLDDGSTFNEALGRSYPGQFEIREPETGDLLVSFPMTGI